MVLEEQTNNKRSYKLLKQIHCSCVHGMFKWYHYTEHAERANDLSFAVALLQ